MNVCGGVRSTDRPGDFGYSSATTSSTTGRPTRSPTGKGFLNPFTWKALGRIEPSAAHPPLYSMYLGVFSWLGFTSALAHRLASCLLGVAAVVVMGLVGRGSPATGAGLIGGGDRGGLPAALDQRRHARVGVDVHPDDRDHAAARRTVCGSRRSWRDAAWLGSRSGCSAMTRPEAVFLVPLFGIPFLFARNLAMAKRSSPCW